jgi:hypothetical protein
VEDIMETNIYFGKVEEFDIDWRDELKEEVDPDDEVLEKTPEDVVYMLGFDPLELE